MRIIDGIFSLSNAILQLILFLFSSFAFVLKNNLDLYNTIVMMSIFIQVAFFLVRNKRVMISNTYIFHDVEFISFTRIFLGYCLCLFSAYYVGQYYLLDIFFMLTPYIFYFSLYRVEKIDIKSSSFTFDKNEKKLLYNTEANNDFSIYYDFSGYDLLERN